MVKERRTFSVQCCFAPGYARFGHSAFFKGQIDGKPSSPDHVPEENIPSRPRTRSQTKRMALMLEEEVGTNGFTSFKVPGFVHSIS